MAKNRETTNVQHPAMLAVGARDDVLVWRQQSGMFYTANGVPVRVGLPGMADAGAVVRVRITPDMVGRVVGVALQAEFKTDIGRQSDVQRNWQAAVQRRGGVYAVVRTADEMTRVVEGVQRGEW